MIRRPPRSTLDRSSAASDVYKRQAEVLVSNAPEFAEKLHETVSAAKPRILLDAVGDLSLIHISEPTRPY